MRPKTWRGFLLSTVISIIGIWLLAKAIVHIIELIK